MKQLLLITLLLSLVPAVAQDFTTQQTMKKIDLGQKLFRNNLQRQCGYTAGYFAQQHTEKEWGELDTVENFKEEFLSMCPRGKEVLKDEWIRPLQLFAIEYAKDSGNRPRC